MCEFEEINLQPLPVFPCRLCGVNRPMRSADWDGLEMPSHILLLKCEVCHTTGVYEVRWERVSKKAIKAALVDNLGTTLPE